jgi:hypothetical protein
MGALFSIAVDLVNYIREFGGNVGQCVYRLAQPEGKETLRAVAKLITEAGIQAEVVYHLVVNYTLLLADMIKIGKYEGVNSDITAEHFPVTGKGKVAINVELWWPNRYFNNGDEVIAALAKEKPDYRFAELPEGLALGAAQPELQRQFPIAIMGSKSIWHHAGGRDFACLGRGDSRRGLYLYWLEGGFDGAWRFAVVRKQS